MNRPPGIEMAQVASVPADPSAASFLRFPAEIRNDIYRLLYDFSSPIFIYPSGNPWKNVRKKTPIPGISLLSSCRQIHHESASILYSENTFTLKFGSGYRSDYIAPYSSAIAGWFQNIGTQLSRVRNVELEGKSWEEFSQFAPILKILWDTGCTPDISFPTVPIIDDDVPQGIVTYVFSALLHDVLLQKKLRGCLDHVLIMTPFMEIGPGEYRRNPIHLDVNFLYNQKDRRRPPGASCYSICKFTFEYATKTFYGKPGANIHNLNSETWGLIIKYVLFPNGDHALDREAFANMSLACKRSQWICERVSCHEDGTDLGVHLFKRR
ncbi:hypothetical protein P154DRAFT_587466 [Amniculicola lignicola CBS 123094]|uniref:F-box domain-containing protein n=1 Tax=Amniculicola lignicola CBS 123094 TaxID=1392246 RepID=A0A6A5VVZ5_9PLEO|nr:hypothetical protein P154DRAFT_587466 [Amniculicola lignicola CBS 123094]